MGGEGGNRGKVVSDRDGATSRHKGRKGRAHKRMRRPIHCVGDTYRQVGQVHRAIWVEDMARLAVDLEGLTPAVGWTGKGG